MKAAYQDLPNQAGNKPAAELPAFAPLIGSCESYGIGRTVAFDLVRKGLLETFTIGRRRYVYLESLRTLPTRLANYTTSNSRDQVGKQVAA